MQPARIHNDWPATFTVDEQALGKALAVHGITDARLYCDTDMPVVSLETSGTSGTRFLRPEAAIVAALTLQARLGQPVVVLRLEPTAIQLTFKTGDFLGYSGNLESQGALLDELAAEWRMVPSHPRDMKLVSTAEKAAAWDEVVEELNKQSPGWDDPAQGIRPVGDAAASVIRYMASAAEWDAMGTMKAHLKNECTIVRNMLGYEGLPPEFVAGLRAHLQRLARF